MSTDYNAIARVIGVRQFADIVGDAGRVPDRIVVVSECVQDRIVRGYPCLSRQTIYIVVRIHRNPVVTIDLPNKVVGRVIFIC